MSSPYTVVPFTDSDMMESARLTKLCFSTDIVHGPMWNNVEEELYSRRFLPLWDAPGVRYYKIVDPETGKMVAYIRWVYPHTLTPEQKEKKEEMKKTKPVYPEGAMADMLEDFFSQIGKGREKWIDHETMFFAHILVVHPDYQRKGLGLMLLKRGLQDADAAGARAYIEASRKGYPLYKKLGFVDVDKMTMDLDKYGLEGGLEDIPFMMREPQGVMLTRPIL